MAHTHNRARKLAQAHASRPPARSPAHTHVHTHTYILTQAPTHAPPQGENSRLASFVGAIAIADLVRTTLGPKGMDKILVSVGQQTGPLVVTNDGATILRSIQIDNAAAKVRGVRTEAVPRNPLAHRCRSRPA